jgi:hypothetical protein
VIHRDIKLDNIFLHANGLIKVILENMNNLGWRFWSF